MANAKLKAGWHLINRLGVNSANQMESVVVPFIRFCYGNPPSPASAAEGANSPGAAREVLISSDSFLS